MFNNRNGTWRLYLGLVVFLFSFYYGETNSNSLRIDISRNGDSAILICSNVNDPEGINNNDIRWERPKGNIISYVRELLLTNVNEEDIASYICSTTEYEETAKYRIYSDRSQRDLITDDHSSPDIIISKASNGKITLQETQNLDLECKVRNWLKNEYDASWTKKHLSISDNSRLFIGSVRQNLHEGVYTCSVNRKNEKNQIHRKNVDVIINLPNNPLSIQVSRQGNNAILTCSNSNDVEGRKIADIRWERPKGYVIAHGPQLVLTNMQEKDLGTYICSTTDSVETSNIKYKVYEDKTISETVVEEHTTPEIIIPNVPSGKITLQETQNLDIECKVQNWLRQDYDVNWIKDGGYVVSNDGRLFIESVQQKQHEGSYACTIIHKIQKGQIYNKKVDLIINVPTVSIEILGGEKLQINGMIHRKCAGFNLENSTETFTYTWFDPLGRKVSSTNTIQVPINDPTVFGSYECHYIATKSQQTFISKVIILAEERVDSQASSYLITITPYPQNFRLKEKFSMRCQVVPALKNITYAWYKNEQLIATNQPTLVFDSFTRANLGVYKCKVSGLNEQNLLIELEAKSFQSLSVFVPVKVELIEGAGSQVAVILSRKKELHCDVSPDSGYSGSQVQWRFEKEELSSESSLNKYNIARVNGRLVSILVLNDAQMINEGHYQCRVGGVTKTVNIVVIQDDGLLIISPAIQKRLEGQPAEFHCRVNDIPNLKNTDIKWFFLTKDGSQRIALPNARWVSSTQQIADRTSFISTDYVTLEDNGYFICTVPTGQESQAELVVEERLRPYVAKAIPPIISVTRTQRFEFECFTQDKYGNPNGDPIIKFLNGTSASEDSRFIVTKIGPSRIRLIAKSGVQVNVKQLQMTCGVEERYSMVTINIKDICPPYHRYCRSGECIGNEKFCDGKVHCSDGSDEDLAYCSSCDPISKPCGHLTTNSTKKQFYNINWACDGERDCDNGFDEKDCKVSPQCDTQYFTCKNGKQIPYAYVCDLNNDCGEGEDEIGCVKPQILRTSEREIQAKIGSTVSLRCEVIGHPLPRVAWRFNWNCLPDETRMTIEETVQNCRKVVSVLTLENVQNGDDAIYNCEALASGSRMLSEPIQLALEH